VGQARGVVREMAEFLREMVFTSTGKGHIIEKSRSRRTKRTEQKVNFAHL